MTFARNEQRDPDANMQQATFGEWELGHIRIWQNSFWLLVLRHHHASVGISRFHAYAEHCARFTPERHERAADGGGGERKINQKTVRMAIGVLR